MVYPKQLPEKYYHSHFNEFLQFITKYCAHLLDEKHILFIEKYHELEHDAQCMLVRVANRKGIFISIDKMLYQEINRCPEQLATLEKVGFLSRVKTEHFKDWLSHLTKHQLFDLVKNIGRLSIKPTAKKHVLLECAIKHCNAHSCLTDDLAQNYLVKCFVSEFDYLLFLFFGSLNSGLDKFSMRDLGVLKTRKKAKYYAARFENSEQAKSTYYYAQKTNRIRQLEKKKIVIQASSYCLELSEYPKAIGSEAEQLKSQYFYVTGKLLLNEDHSLALKYLRASPYYKAQEKWLRELYKLEEKEKVKALLDDIIHSSLDENLVLFAEDFYQRKYNQVKISKLTEKLRNDSYFLRLDEVHRGRAELGVMQHYQSKNIQVFFTENQLFNVLFGLTFWRELFEQNAPAVFSEFDCKPGLLRNNTFYQQMADEIESRLSIFSSIKRAIGYLTKIAAENYGQPNGIFVWRAEIMEQVALFLQYAKKRAVIELLRCMAKDYHSLRHGYPDLMLIDNGQLRFEEVKAQGDAIRPNQLFTINVMQNVGFDVHICRVNWFSNPMQSYVVVDVETTGGKRSHHRITEIGAVKIVNGEVIDTWSSLINPQRHIPGFITKLTGINNDMVKDAPLFGEVAKDLGQFMQNSIFVAHNVDFDYGFFKVEYDRIGQYWSMPKLCTVRESRKCFPGLKSYSLGNLCKAFDISLDNHHRALCDAKAAAEILMLINQHKQDMKCH